MNTTPLHDIVKRSARLASSSKRNYLADLDRWVAFAGPSPERWTKYRAQEFYDHLIRSGLKPQSATRVMMSLRYAASMRSKLEDKPELDFTSAIEFAKRTRREKRPALDEDQAKRLLLSLERARPSQDPEALRDFAFFVVALETGMRIMSLTAMQIESTGKQAKLSYPAAMVPIKGHGDVRFAVPLSDTAIAALDSWIGWLRRNQITVGSIFRPVRYSPVQRKHVISGTPTIRTLYNVTVRRTKAAGLQHVHPHIFRHTFVTWRLIAGVPPEQISAITLHRLEGDRLGELYTYTDREGQIAETARNTTPAWLRELVIGEE